MPLPRLPRLPWLPLLPRGGFGPRRIAAGDEPAPAWWKKLQPDYFELCLRSWELTIEPIKGLRVVTPTGRAIFVSMTDP